MKLEILSFEWNLFKSDEVISVTAMTSVWEITILKDHISLLTSLKPSVLEVKYLKNWIETSEDFAIWWWSLEVSDNKVRVLVDMLVTVDNADFEQAEKARKEAEKLIEEYKKNKDKISMEEFIEAEDIILKSIAQLKIKR